MKFFFLTILFFISVVCWQTKADNWQYDTKLLQRTYADAAAFCVEDGDQMWLPNINLLFKVIWAGDLGYLNQWFWSSTEVPDELCPEKSCHYQGHSQTLESRIGIDNEASASALCVRY